MGGLHDDGHVEPGFAHLGQHAKSVEVGHHEVEHHAIDARLAAGQDGERQVAAFGRDRLVARPADHVPDQPTGDPVLFDDQDAFGHDSPRTLLSRIGTLWPIGLNVLLSLWFPMRESFWIVAGSRSAIASPRGGCGGGGPPPVPPPARRQRRRSPPMSPRSSLASAKPTRSKPDALPEWNLADLYPSLDAPEVKADLDRVDADCQAFEETYKGRLADMAPSAGARRPRAPARTRPRPRHPTL